MRRKGTCWVQVEEANEDGSDESTEDIISVNIFIPLGVATYG